MRNVKASDLIGMLHYQLPKWLFDMLLANKITLGAFKTYVLMYDRLRLSCENNWIDENGDVYIVYSYSSLEKDLNCSRQAVANNLNDLKKLDLLEIKSGYRKANVYFLKITSQENFTSQEKLTTISKEKLTRTSQVLLDCNKNNINKNKDNNNKVSCVETEEDKKSETNRTDLLNKITELKKIVADATGESNGTVEMMMQPRIYIDCIDELLAKIKASDYLMGRKDRKPCLKTFVYKTKEILAGFYDDYKKEESKPEEKKHNFTFDAEIFKFLQENEDFLTDKQQRQYEFMKEELRRNANSKGNS